MALDEGENGRTDTDMRKPKRLKLRRTPSHGGESEGKVRRAKRRSKRRQRQGERD